VSSKDTQQFQHGLGHRMDLCFLNSAKRLSDIAGPQERREMRHLRRIALAGGIVLPWMLVAGAAMASCDISGNIQFGYTGAVQNCTITQSGSYLITAYGAQGSGITLTPTSGGLGAEAQALFNLVSGQSVEIIVGGQGQADGNTGGGGGGGTFLFSGGAPELVAGGGGSWNSYWDGLPSGGTKATSGTSNGNNSLSGGTNGGNGENSAYGTYGGYGYISVLANNGAANDGAGGFGGFGGGGGQSASNGGAGGGGGYSGGAAGWNAPGTGYYGGGGGGSYSLSTSSALLASAVQSGNGALDFQLSTAQPSPSNIDVPEPPGILLFVPALLGLGFVRRPSMRCVATELVCAKRKAYT